MVDIKRYLEQLIQQLRREFDTRLLYVGLQGSYLRGEATEHSDIDVMVVLDELRICDLNAYRAIIKSMEGADKSCGFLCGRDDLANWNPLEIHHLLHSTRDVYGALQPLVPTYSREDVRNFIKLSVGNLYHELCHRYVHAPRESAVSALPGTYKGVFFILQDLYDLRHGMFVPTRAELLSRLEGDDRAVLKRAMRLNAGEAFDFDDSFALLFRWCQQTLKAL